jgi:hypothetical protein
MTLRRAALGLCALCALGTGGREEDGITAAVERSPYTYFHYASSIWWGAPVHVSIRATAVEGHSGGAVVEVRPRTGAIATSCEGSRPSFTPA